MPEMSRPGWVARLSSRAGALATGSANWAPWARAGVLVLVTRLLFLVIAYAGAVLLVPASGSGHAAFPAMWAHYDALRFEDIARHGYSGPDSDPNNTAFFPVFPLAIRIVSAIGLSDVAAGLLISVAASLVAGVFLYRLAKEAFGEAAGPRAVLYLMLFPTAVFLVAPYSEALFLAGAVPAFYYARRSQWPRVAVPAALAVGTRVTGVFLVLGLVAEFLRQRRFDRGTVLRALGGIAVGCLPLIAYASYLWWTRGNPLDFVAAQHRGWHRDLVSPISAFLSTWHVFWNAQLGDTPVTGGPRLVWFGEMAAAALGIMFTVLAARRREWGYAVFMGSLMAVLLVNGPTYLSIPRMLLTLFPIPLLLAGITQGRPLLHQVILTVFAVLATFGVLVFTGGTAWFY
jgi:hypothetical protein